jgi:hypothetical protein
MLILGFFVFGPTPSATLFGVINGALHFVVDFFTSKITSSLWGKKELHNFFAVIGFDQLIHNITIIATFCIFLPI